MGFRAEFRPGRPRGEELSSELPETDSGYEVFVMDACALLSEVGGAEFVLSGFGRESWPVDVDYDMSAFMEQLPELLECVRQGETVEVDLYSQGIECKLTFAPENDDVAIGCASRTDWVPNPSIERIARTDLIEMLERFAAAFARGLELIDPGLVTVAPADTWLSWVRPEA